MKTNDTDFAVETLNKTLVRGGFENGYILNIGRIAFQGETVTGKIVTNSGDYPGTAPMFFAFRNKENKANYYEVLIYEPADENAIDKVFVRNRTGASS